MLLVHPSSHLLRQTKSQISLLVVCCPLLHARTTPHTTVTAINGGATTTRARSNHRGRRSLLRRQSLSRSTTRITTAGNTNFRALFRRPVRWNGEAEAVDY